MRTIRLTYEHKTANGSWVRKAIVFCNGKDYEYAVNVIHENTFEYKVVNVEHI